ncbi:MAG: SDR family oxidoreductase [Planctomycetota bacterium]
MSAAAPWAGRVAVITGASRGLGLGLAETFREHGLALGLCARTPPPLVGEKVVARPVDVRDAAAMRAFAEEVRDRLGPIDLWVNNAAVLEPIAFARELGAEALLEHLRTNLAGALHGAQAFLATRAPEATLINVSSGAALKGYAGWGAYCASKAALDRLSECLALEEGAGGLRVFSVAPGVIDTDMQRTIRALPPERFPEVEKFHELKRQEAFNSPRHVAEHFLRIAFDPAARPDAVVARLPAER